MKTQDESDTVHSPPPQVIGWKFLGYSCIAIFLIPVCGFLLVLFSLFFPGCWKSTVGKVDIEGVGRLSVGTVHTGGIDPWSDYVVKIQGRNEKYSEWTYFGWGPDIHEKCLSAVSRNGQFYCIYSFHSMLVPHLISSNDLPEALDLNLMVIYDVESGTIWPTKSSTIKPLSYWLEAWRVLREADPEVPPIPDLLEESMSKEAA